MSASFEERIDALIAALRALQEANTAYLDGASAAKAAAVVAEMTDDLRKRREELLEHLAQVRRSPRLPPRPTTEAQWRLYRRNR